MLGFESEPYAHLTIAEFSQLLVNDADRVIPFIKDFLARLPPVKTRQILRYLLSLQQAPTDMKPPEDVNELRVQFANLQEELR